MSPGNLDILVLKIAVVKHVTIYSELHFCSQQRDRTLHPYCERVAVMKNNLAYEYPATTFEQCTFSEDEDAIYTLSLRL
jgi:hypothetical protein